MSLAEQIREMCAGFNGRIGLAAPQAYHYQLFQRFPVTAVSGHDLAKELLCASHIAARKAAAGPAQHFHNLGDDKPLLIALSIYLS